MHRCAVGCSAAAHRDAPVRRRGGCRTIRSTGTRYPGYRRPVLSSRRKRRLPGWHYDLDLRSEPRTDGSFGHRRIDCPKPAGPLEVQSRLHAPRHPSTSTANGRDSIPVASTNSWSVPSHPIARGRRMLRYRRRVPRQAGTYVQGDAPFGAPRRQAFVNGEPHSAAVGFRSTTTRATRRPTTSPSRCRVAGRQSPPRCARQPSPNLDAVSGTGVAATDGDIWLSSDSATTSSAAARAQGGQLLRLVASFGDESSAGFVRRSPDPGVCRG